MPEGPSILIAKEALSAFIGKKVLAASGNAKIQMSQMDGKVISDIKTWGKHLILCFPGFFIRIHFLMFGTYLVNERKNLASRLTLKFKNGEINFYTCSVKLIDLPVEEVYDFTADVLSPTWNARKAGKKLRDDPGRLVSDVLLDQTIFAGVGNIIKNEVLFRIRVHPKSIVEKLSPAKRSSLIREARNYSYDFLKWKRNYELKKHWLIYRKKICPRDHHQVKCEYLGKGNRQTFFCEKCQTLYR